MSLGELKEMSNKAGLFKGVLFGERDVYIAFKLSMQTQVDEMTKFPKC